jgi:hypothetical protein
MKVEKTDRINEEIQNIIKYVPKGGGKSPKGGLGE